MSCHTPAVYLSGGDKSDSNAKDDGTERMEAMLRIIGNEINEVDAGVGPDSSDEHEETSAPDDMWSRS